ncbi:hypothetical protein NL676_018108, partial [Syzygium grande]
VPPAAFPELIKQLRSIMSSPLQSVHIVFIPLLAQGHMIPMVDMVRIFALRGAIATIDTTPVNALRVRTTIDRSGELGMPIRLVEIPFPCEEVGLPIGFENLDILPSPELLTNSGVVVNSFDELEHECIEAYQKVIGKIIWSIGPVSLCNKDESDMFQRGNKASGNSEKCMAWLDSMRSRSVIYACLGSLCRLVPSQLMELGRGLGASQQPFVWVIKREEGDSELENWLIEERFEEKVKGRGIVIRGWAPQVAMLSHPAIGGFLTHCSWNSTLEGVCSALPMITWPLFSEQFVNEVLVVDILKIGVRMGEERKVGILVKEDEIVRAINALVSEDGEGEERRKRAAELGEKA